MDIEALSYINKDEIAQLLSNYPLGIRIKFSYFIQKWQSSKRQNNESSLSTPSFTSPCSSLESTIDFSIDKLLSNCTQGALIMNYYKSNNNLNESCRNLLIDLIIANLIDKNHPMSISLGNHISDMIVGTFTTEIKVNIIYILVLYFYCITQFVTTQYLTNCIIYLLIILKEVYFVRDGTKKCPKGKLYTKYFNKLRTLKYHGLVSQQSKIQKNCEKDNSSHVSENIDVGISN